MATDKPKLRQRCEDCGSTVRRTWPTRLTCTCGGAFALAPRECKLSSTDRFHISILGHCVLRGMRRPSQWNYTKIAQAYGVDRKVVQQCMDQHPL